MFYEENVKNIKKVYATYLEKEIKEVFEFEAPDYEMEEE